MFINIYPLKQISSYAPGSSYGNIIISSVMIFFIVRDYKGPPLVIVPKCFENGDVKLTVFIKT